MPPDRRDNPGLHERLRDCAEPCLHDPLDAIDAESSRTDELPPYPDDDEPAPPPR